METHGKVPITIISGYLGSGKTSLILHLLKCKQKKRVGIIVNDVAEVNVDAKNIRNSEFFSEEDCLISLQNGSISHSLKEDLVEAVYTLSSSGKIDEIYIESTGIAQPDLIAKYIQHGESNNHIQLTEVSIIDALITVVDVFRLAQQFSSENGKFNENYTESNLVIMNQIEFCDILLFNKIDMVTEKEKEYLKTIVKQIQPTAHFIECTFSQVGVNKITNTRLFSGEDEINLFDNGTYNLEKLENNFHIDTFVYTRREPFHPERFDQWLDRWPKEVTRCKGVAWFVSQPNNVIKISQSGRAMDIIHSGYWIAALKKWEIEKMLSIRTNLKDIWDPLYGDRMIELVFIGTNMKKEQIIKDLDNCLVKEGEPVQIESDPFKTVDYF